MKEHKQHNRIAEDFWGWKLGSWITLYSASMLELSNWQIIIEVVYVYSTNKIEARSHESVPMS